MYRKAIQVYESLLPFYFPIQLIRQILIHLGSTTTLPAVTVRYEKDKKREEFYESVFQIAQVQDRYLRNVKGHLPDPGLFGMTLTALGNINLQLAKTEGPRLFLPGSPVLERRVGKETITVLFSLA